MILSVEKKSETTPKTLSLKKGKLLIKKLSSQNKKFRYLRELHEIIEATSIEELEKLMTYHQPDLILFETSPEFSAIELKKCNSLKLNSKSFQIPIILIAQDCSINCYKLCTEIGAEAYLKENFQWDLLPLLIEKFIPSKEKVNVSTAEKLNEPPPGDTHFISELNRLISENLDNPGFNVAFLCESLAMSRSLVYKKLKSLEGLSIVEYIRKQRINEAMNLLKTGRYKIFEVAYMVGFSNQKYFRKIFVRQFGSPPSKFIENKA